jgi:transcription initiation factor TFIIIB Brf1 subunit/transcription initiation factor TFIIB
MIDMSAGDLGTLKEAADLVQQKSRRGSTISHSPEHLAFSVITAAHRALIDDPDQVPRR